MSNFGQMLKPEPRMKGWDRVRDTEIIPQFKEWHITTCELGSENDYLYSVCKKFMYLGFAHTKKRKDIKTPKDLRRVALACSACHEVVEYRCKEATGLTMEQFIEKVIQKREARLNA